MLTHHQFPFPSHVAGCLPPHEFYASSTTPDSVIQLNTAVTLVKSSGTDSGHRSVKTRVVDLAGTALLHPSHPDAKTSVQAQTLASELDRSLKAVTQEPNESQFHSLQPLYL
ncbi:hypothetical protein RRG08_056671 [Elysia crispata]|uniref:Uncharacterized protein n=1 Tax=Elysia crispata TaxID=231223 RepID=A0AAE0YH18_9GAST|nr:hypothetical protein RRG08_056671 [Elysia crispata]